MNMNAIPLRFGPLKADSYNIVRSGVRWLVEDGQPCRANQPIGYCNISLEPSGARLSSAPTFAEEQDIQVVFAPRVAGRLAIQPEMARGGYLNTRAIDAWDPDTVAARITPDTPPDMPDAGRLRLMVVAGRRMTRLADVHTGLLSGWYSRSRGWWCEDNELPMTLLSMGVCDATGVILGEKCGFLDMFEAARAATQCVFVPDHPLAPCAPILLEQLERTPAQFNAIAEDLRQFLGRPGSHPTAEDWIFAGTLLSVLRHTPLKDRLDIFSDTGTHRLPPANAVLMSLNVEPQSILRHRTLGYHVHIMRHHLAGAGPAIRAWLSGAFEPVRRTLDVIRRDYERLIDTLARTTGGRILILNRMSTSGYEDISNYSAFDAPMSATLSNIAAKEQNLMLHDISETRGLAVIDVDALGAELGGGLHLPDGIHQSGRMQMELRHEILHALSDLRPTRAAARAPASAAG
ncbi:hypothetical protein [Komagataeibacter sp. FNDCR2]|uniref:hypothetical protein n=1 Tax=Komagataeibacter sp. FNDCR2 TaxID=2878682 RepID=UPI001E3DCA65|nr:hypothetical protein [Komagataeibacter sp. FNDCR2]MCE2574220.1 hypothetical protein [Komagataeibacter sp. FNDCR2]